ncbi:UDP-N-acetyl-D-mannosamine dehydrogenase [Bibersteinia trehalosi USDA-ARS-USMARC-188]|uniref:UDP-N-acetyl-D-mannosamine dehydrogenase n=2 Tax=Bibersteinia trehalosi TaxID=47735 RepID=A0A4V7I7J4_BIBTR|nr:UDP-N-acetyl-D-mannosamine dehydrogenase [Bibersteinia trehalosi]AGH39273.1 UDP-N-acetyl-D-mannosamine dehydrogenase [Bibersteinia trehalosi USDA-ARS-USMARC-192]AHG80981.1 UDP-N-acetyl-D-mannosamine dehydrogenase [Bibersteinia trehalosi USDA-ARS-USMARC-188]AHG83193.1 UDP-N-acetyl-D-mannosamine dehydrogenase [Bibersteinia trehalosi USDA-ARS-USMARC-189]
MINKLCVIGLGYIGLPTATVFALAGKQVIGVDTNPQVIESLAQGKLHFLEPQLTEKLQQALQSGYFSAKSRPEAADVFIIAVPTPLNDAQQPDLSYIRQASESIAPVLANGNLIVLESTSPVGTTEQLAQWLKELRPDLSELLFAYCPERVLPGKIMQEIYHNDRIIGGLSAQATAQAVHLYQIFTKGECVPTSARLAEMCKLTENSFRDVNIAFANELSLICDHLNISVWELIRLANRHPRVNILQPGAGVGGHCIAVDPHFIVAQSPKQARLIHMARTVNDSKPAWVIEKVKLAVADYAMANDKKPSDIRIACLGLSFKADIDDLRESPALEITQNLAQWHQGELWVVEPHIQQLPTILQNKANLVPLAQALQSADVVVLLVDHQAFKQMQAPENKVIVDTRGIWLR